MSRKYINISVSSEINVSSSGHFSVHVSWRGSKGRLYDFDCGFMTNHEYNAINWEGAPQYLIRETLRQIVEMITTRAAKYYEYDRDGNKRYENLRYYEPELAQWWAEHFAKALTGTEGKS